MPARPPSNLKGFPPATEGEPFPAEIRHKGGKGIVQRILRHLAVELAANALLAVSITMFEVPANFAPGGVSGLAVMANYLFHTPIGLVTIVLNIPIVLLTWRKLGTAFFVNSAVTMLIGALMVDFVFVNMPDPGVPRLLSAILAGLIGGIGYAPIFRHNSSTGGTDFIIVALQRSHPSKPLGLYIFLVDGAIIALSVPVFGDWYAFVLGLTYTLVVSLVIDGVNLLIDGRRRPLDTSNQQKG